MVLGFKSSCQNFRVLGSFFEFLQFWFQGLEIRGQGVGCRFHRSRPRLQNSNQWSGLSFRTQASRWSIRIRVSDLGFGY